MFEVPHQNEVEVEIYLHVYVMRTIIAKIGGQDSKT